MFDNYDFNKKRSQFLNGNKNIDCLTSLSPDLQNLIIKVKLNEKQTKSKS